MPPQNVTRSVVISEASHDTRKDIDRLIRRLQAHTRGYLLRRRLADERQKVVAIQAWWRGLLQRRKYASLLEARIRRRADDACRFARVKSKYRDTLDHYREHVS